MRNVVGELQARTVLDATPVALEVVPGKSALGVGAEDGSLVLLSFTGSAVNVSARLTASSAAVTHLAVDSTAKFCLVVTADRRLSVFALFPSPTLAGFLPLPAAGSVSSLTVTAFPDGTVKFAVAQMAEEGPGGTLVTGVLPKSLDASRPTKTPLEFTPNELTLQQATLKETPGAVCITSESLLAVFSADQDNINLYDWNISTRSC